MNTLEQRIVAAARGWIGVPFEHQGRSRAGIDCAGLVIEVAREVGLIDARWNVTGYLARPDGQSLRALCERNLEPAGAPVPGGVVLVAWLRGPPQHLGIVAEHPLGGLTIVHADGRRARAVVEQRLVVSRALQLVAAYRMRPVA